MQYLQRFFVLIACSLFLIFCGFGQSFAQMKQLPSSLLPALDATQLTQSQLSALMNDKNRSNAGKDKNAETENDAKPVKDSTLPKRIVSNKIASGIETFGANVFFESSVADLSELSTPPLDYPIGVGDHVVVSLWGAAEFQKSFLVGRDGTIFPEGVGKINVQGLTYEEMRAVVTAKFKKVVPGATKISVSVGQPRTININVVGNVNNPGPVTVSAFSNAFNVIAKAGGINEFGNLRSIQIKRNGKLIDELDVYQYLVSGDLGKQTYLSNNDFVVVGFADKKILTKGEFKRPMYYQLKKQEGVKALMLYSGGLKPEASGSIVHVTRIENEKQIQRDLNVVNLMNMNGQEFVLEDGDVVTAGSIRNELFNKVELQGEINYPGVYEYRTGQKLFDFIAKAGGLTKSTYLYKAYVFRGALDPSNYKPERIEIDLLNIQNANSVSNIELQSNDLIQFFNKNEFEEKEYVEIYGEVRKGGRFRRYVGMTLQDLLYLSGGLNQSAEFGRLEVSSIVNIDSALHGLNPTKTIVNSYAVQQNLQLDSVANKVLLKPFDQVFVRKNPTFELQQNIELKGMVRYPGMYSRLDKQERLSSFIERAGGLTENANRMGAVLLRKSKIEFSELIFDSSRIKLDSNGLIIKDSLPVEIKYKDKPISIDLDKALRNKNSKYDVVLQQNDVVYIPEIDPFVSVVGRVQSAIKTTYVAGHKNLGFYINKAGGFGVKPWKRRIYVTNASGKSKRTKNFLFFHFYPKVDRGSIITVPERPQGQAFGEFAKATLMSAIPVVISAIVFKYVN